MELEHPGAFPSDTIETPFMPALALMRRSIFNEVRFDEHYRGNAYREESDFFVRAARAGYKVMVTPATYSWQVAQYVGGTRRPRLRYEYWVVRNNWLFLRRHGRWLAENGHVADPVSAQVHFTQQRLRTLTRGYLSASWRRRRERADLPA
jgi:GT2 family glycosyltransferase